MDCLSINEDWISTFGLEDYKFKSYSVNFNNSLSGTLGGFFDKTWFEYGVSENEKTADNFAIALVDAVIEMEATEYYDAWLIGIDSSPAYTLTISGLPESSEACHFDVYFDICELSEYVLPLGNIDIDKSELDF